jgi:hypothetical protein
MSNRVLAGLVLALIFSQVVSAEDNSADGDRQAECFATYDALVGLGEAGKLPTDETDGYRVKRGQAETRALSQYKTEGLDAENAHGQLEGRAEYMREELRDLHEGSGIYDASEMKRMATACDPVVSE